MTNQISLTKGSLITILDQRSEHLRPIVQILSSKIMSNNRIRTAIYDGQTICQHCIFVSDEIKDKYDQGLLEDFTIIRIEHYTISWLTDKNISLILINQLSIIKKGNDVKKKLDSANFIEIPSNTIQLNTHKIKSMPESPMMIPKKKMHGAESIDIEIKSERICFINQLIQNYNSWIVQALVTNKASIHTYDNEKGKGKFFSFDIYDNSGEIRVIAFNEECDRFFELIEKGKVYYIGKGSLKTTNKKYSKFNNDYEICLNPSSFIKLCNDVKIEFPKKCYKFSDISSISNLLPNTTIDIIGIIHSVGEIEKIVNKKTFKEMKKKDIFIVDKSMAQVRLTLWNDQVNFNGHPKQVIAIKNAIVMEFKGKTLSCRDSTSIEIEPNLPETNLLHIWYQTLDPNKKFLVLSNSTTINDINNIRYIAQINQKKLLSGTLDFSCFATIQAFSNYKNHFYKSCGFNGCKKKLLDESNGLYYCGKCNRTSPTFIWCLKMSLLLNDLSGSFWITCFQNNLIKMLNKSYTELFQLYENDSKQYLNILNQLRFKTFDFHIHTRLQNYNNEPRIQHILSQVYQISSINRSLRLMQCIDILNNQI